MSEVATVQGRSGGGRAARSMATFAAGQGYLLLGALSGFVATPLVLNWLGDTRFGAFRAAADWLGYLELVELGISGALPVLLARAWGEGDRNALHAAMVAGARAYAGIALLMVVSSIGLAAAVSTLIPVPASDRWDLARGCLVAALSFVTMPFYPFRALTEAQQRGYWVSGLFTARVLLIAALSVLLAWMAWGISGQFAAQVVGDLVLYLALFTLQRKSFPGLLTESFKSRASAEVRRELWKLSRPTLVMTICGRIGLLTDNIIIARLLSPGLVTAFYVTQRLVVIVLSGLQGVGASSWAALAELHAQGRRELFNRRLLELTRLVAILACAAVIPLVAYNRGFVTRWVGSGRYGGDLLTLVVGANALLRSVFTVWGFSINGTGHMGRLAPAVVYETVINLTASIVLTRLAGLPGPVLGTLIGLLTVRAWFVPGLLVRLFGISLGELARALTLPAAVAAPYAAAVWWFARAHGAAGYLGMLSEMSAAALIYLGLAWMVVLSKDERAAWRERADRLLRWQRSA